MGGPVRDAARTRERIVAAARAHFAAHGLDRSTVRAIAADAGVAPNLITRYFGGKQGLFEAATRVDLRVGDSMDGPLEELGARIATRAVRRWDSAAGDDPLLILMRAAAADGSAAAQMAEFFRVHATDVLAARLGGDEEAEDRALAVNMVIMGTAMQRHVLAAGPVAAATSDHLAGWLGSVLQGLITGPRPSPLR